MRVPRPALLRTVAVTTAVALGAVMVSAASANAAASGQIRLDGVGYAHDETKIGYLMAPASSEGARFTVVDTAGRTVLAGKAGASLGSWNAGYAAVHPLDFSALKRPGSYRVTVTGAVQASSATFKIGTARELFGPVADKTFDFYAAQRDGGDVVPGKLNRQPAHLSDAKATVYDTPKFRPDDQLAEPLKPTGQTVDLEGGWVDAGDFVKFTSNTAYTIGELLLVQREGNRDRTLASEIDFGLKWLDKAWDEKSKTFYVQVGIGVGSPDLGILGDHDVWRLPETDDKLQVKPGDEKYFIKHRPVFRAAAPGEKISPNLAGRAAAAFALAAQVEARRDWRKARYYLEQAASVFAQAKTTDVGQLTTAFPHSYYPENSWTDDLEYGATQLALAGYALGDRRAGDWATAATEWAKAYLGSGDQDTLNLYNTSALGHTDLVKVLRTKWVRNAQVTEAQLIGDLRRQLDKGVTRAATSPFRTAVDITAFDVATRSFGYAATVELYRSVTRDRGYDAFGSQQRNFALGANSWGLSLVIGVGPRFPYCPHHQAANLSGSTTGGEKILVGGVVNGPNAAAKFASLGDLPGGGVECTHPMAAFDGQGSRFVDDVRAWPSSEPAIDYTATGTLALGLTALR
ncbi:glycoside hydrolase family 9 protein [Crossiella sp. CA198]|uniref:glycoside hydrolase family 9 protein n=1 Tax=Crossiella sp. CA198 TaxID=3455607 RepID=UPI003F8D2E53